MVEVFEEEEQEEEVGEVASHSVDGTLLQYCKCANDDVVNDDQCACVHYVCAICMR